MTTKIEIGKIYKLNVKTKTSDKFDEVVVFLAERNGWQYVVINGKGKERQFSITRESVCKHWLITQNEFDSIDWSDDKNPKITKYDYDNKVDLSLIFKYDESTNVIYHDNEGEIEGEFIVYDNQENNGGEYSMNICGENGNVDFESEDIVKLEVIDEKLHIWMN